jgi:glycosyltransferase involved in cell wall biosynthesis
VQANGARALGFVDSETKRDFLAAIDVLAMPSRTEAFGIAYLEAWANGKPVIGARSGAVTTVIREGIDGLLVDFGDTNQLSKALEALILSPELCRTMGESGRQRALTEYRWDSVIDRVRRAYSEALGVPEEAV